MAMVVTRFPVAMASVSIQTAPMRVCIPTCCKQHCAQDEMKFGHGLRLSQVSNAIPVKESALHFVTSRNMPQFGVLSHPLFMGYFEVSIFGIGRVSVML